MDLARFFAFLGVGEVIRRADFKGPNCLKIKGHRPPERLSTPGGDSGDCDRSFSWLICGLQHRLVKTFYFMFEKYPVYCSPNGSCIHEKKNHL